MILKSFFKTLFPFYSVDLIGFLILNYTFIEIKSYLVTIFSLTFCIYVKSEITYNFLVLSLSGFSISKNKLSDLSFSPHSVKQVFFVCLFLDSVYLFIENLLKVFGLGISDGERTLD